MIDDKKENEYKTSNDILLKKISNSKHSDNESVSSNAQKKK